MTTTPLFCKKHQAFHERVDIFPIRQRRSATTFRCSLPCAKLPLLDFFESGVSPANMTRSAASGPENSGKIPSSLCSALPRWINRIKVNPGDLFAISAVLELPNRRWNYQD